MMQQYLADDAHNYSEAHSRNSVITDPVFMLI